MSTPLVVVRFGDVIGAVDSVSVRLVDGQTVRDEVSVDFVEGGNSGRYSFVPEDEIWVEAVMTPEDQAATVVHEFIEREHMLSDGLSYDDAHDVANTVEHEFRADCNPALRSADVLDAARAYLQGRRRVVEAAAHSGVMLAVYPPADVAQQLAVPGGEPADGLHVTLAYYKPVPSGFFEQALLAVKPVARRWGILLGRISGQGRFPASETSDGKDVVWVPVDAPRLEDLRAQCVAAVERATGQTPRADHGFTPHMTLAYVGPGAPAPTPTVAMATHFEEVPFRAVWVVQDPRREAVALTGAEGLRVQARAQIEELTMPRTAMTYEEPWDPSRPYDERTGLPVFDWTDEALAPALAPAPAPTPESAHLVDPELDPRLVGVLPSASTPWARDPDVAARATGWEYFEDPEAAAESAPAPFARRTPATFSSEPEEALREYLELTTSYKKRRKELTARTSEARTALREFKSTLPPARERTPEQRVRLAELEQQVVVARAAQQEYNESIDRARARLLGPEMLERLEHVEGLRSQKEYTEDPPEGWYKSPISEPEPETRYANVRALGIEPNFGAGQSYKSAETGIQNIISVYDHASDAHKEYGARWYSTANGDAKRLAEAYNVTPEVAAGVIAALSPNTKWDANIRAAQQMLRGFGSSVARRIRERAKLGRERALAEHFPDVYTDPKTMGQGVYRVPVTDAQDIIDAYRVSGASPAILGRDGTQFFVGDAAEVEAKIDELFAGGASIYAPRLKRQPKSAELQALDRSGDSPDSVRAVYPEVNVKFGRQNPLLSDLALPDGKYGFWAVSPLTGPKRNSFYQNIIDPEYSADNPTVDGHAFNIFRGRVGSLETDTSVPEAAYPAIQNAYREAARRINERDGTDLSAQAVQAITWTVWRDVLNMKGARKVTARVTAQAVVATEAALVAESAVGLVPTFGFWRGAAVLPPLLADAFSALRRLVEVEPLDDDHWLVKPRGAAVDATDLREWAEPFLRGQHVKLRVSQSNNVLIVDLSQATPLAKGTASPVTQLWHKLKTSAHVRVSSLSRVAASASFNDLARRYMQELVDVLRTEFGASKGLIFDRSKPVFYWAFGFVMHPGTDLATRLVYVTLEKERFAYSVADYDPHARNRSLGAAAETLLADGGFSFNQRPDEAAQAIAHAVRSAAYNPY